MAGPSDTDVIAAVGTAPGRAGIGVVRVSGKRLGQLASHLLGGVPAPRRAVRAVFRGAAGEPIDDGIAEDRAHGSSRRRSPTQQMPCKLPPPPQIGRANV